MTDPLSVTKFIKFLKFNSKFIFRDQRILFFVVFSNIIITSSDLIENQFLKFFGITNFLIFTIIQYWGFNINNGCFRTLESRFQFLFFVIIYDK